MQPSFSLNKNSRVLTIELAGNWKMPDACGSNDSQASLLIADTLKAMETGSFSSLAFSSLRLEGWDSLLLSSMLAIFRAAAKQGIGVSAEGLPRGMPPMLDMALAVPERTQRSPQHDPGLLELIGEKILAWPKITYNLLEFLGEVTTSTGRFLCGRASFSRKDMLAVFRECGVDALPIVTLTSLLLGLILAFVSSMQLRLFGAEVYVASLVGVSMVRVMGPVLTGIVLAGRTGASFAAVIGSMQVNEEVDALTGFGISPMDFLVLPRVLGLAVMTPLLALYADLAGIAGGFLVGILMLGISPSAYLENTLSFLSLDYVWIGLVHAFVFGIIISLCGCYQGMRSGRNASAVGKATTAAVVYSIVGIIISTSIITIILTVIDL